MTERVFYERWQVETLDDLAGPRKAADADQLWFVTEGPFKTLTEAQAARRRLTADEDEGLWTTRITHTVRSVCEAED